MVGETVDEWQSLYPAAVSSRVEAAGSLRVRSRYQHEVIMPLKEYTSLKEVSDIYICIISDSRLKHEVCHC